MKSMIVALVAVLAAVVAANIIIPTPGAHGSPSAGGIIVQPGPRA